MILRKNISESGVIAPALKSLNTGAANKIPKGTSMKKMNKAVLTKAFLLMLDRDGIRGRCVRVEKSL